MYLKWSVLVRSDGSCRVPPAASDGEMALADCEYPDVAAALADLYSAVIEEYVNPGREPCRVSFDFQFLPQPQPALPGAEEAS